MDVANVNNSIVTRSEALEYRKKSREIIKKEPVERSIEASKLLDEISKRQKSYASKRILSLPALFSSSALVGTALFKLLSKKNTKGINKVLKTEGIITAVSVAAYLISSLIIKDKSKGIQQKCNDKVKKKVDEFNKENNLNLEYEIASTSDNGMASFSYADFKLFIDPDYGYDPVYLKTHIDYCIEHELTHAKQVMLISRLEGGIEKLNLAVFNRIAKEIKNNPKQKEDFDKVIEQIKQNPDKYKNETYIIEGRKYNFVDLYMTLNKIIENPDLKEGDIPVLINKQAYEQVRKNFGKLTPDEEKKAQEYLRAWTDYPKINLLQVINPNSKYHQNILEKEATKNRPWYTYLF